MTESESEMALHDSLDRLGESIDRVMEQRGHICKVLAEFYCAPLSMSSVQPILDLAVELNPSLKESK